MAGSDDDKDLTDGFTNSTYNSWALNSTGIGWINKGPGAWTKLGLREGHDVLDHAISTETNSIKGSGSNTAGTDQDPYLEVILTPKTNVPYAISTVAGGQFLIMNNSTTYTATATTDINDNEWHHIVGTYDKTAMKIYIDGTLEDTNTDFSGNLPIVDGNLRIGADYQPIPDNFFNGLIDEARIYNRALSADEIAEQYRVGARKLQANTPITNYLTDGLVGHWTFNGPDMDWASTTAEALDMSGQGNYGDVIGATAAIGKVGQGLEFDGSNDYIEAGNVYNGVKTVTFWIKTDGSEDAAYFDGQLDEVRFYDRTLSADQIGQLYRIGNRSMKIGSGADSAFSAISPGSKIIDLNDTVNIEVSSGTITANGFTGPIIYVDASVSSTIDDNWRFVAITTGTGVNASTTRLGAVGFLCGDQLTDYDSNTYNTVQIGEQCWMAENLMVLHNADGTDPDDTGDPDTRPPTNYDDADWEETEGYLYNWQAAMNGTTTEGAQGICPTGWHVPTDTEWKTLEGTVDSTYGVGNSEWDGTGWRGDDAGRELKAANNVNGKTGATNGDDGYGFTSLLAGYWHNSGAFSGRGADAIFWSSLQHYSSNAWARNLNSSDATVNRAYGDKGGGFSVRCLKD